MHPRGYGTCVVPVLYLHHAGDAQPPAEQLVGDLRPREGSDMSRGSGIRQMCRWDEPPPQNQACEMMPRTLGSPVPSVATLTAYPSLSLPFSTFLHSPHVPFEKKWSPPPSLLLSPHLEEAVPGLGDAAAERAVGRNLGECVEQRTTRHSHVVEPQLAL